MLKHGLEIIATFMLTFTFLLVKIHVSDITLKINLTQMFLANTSSSLNYKQIYIF